MSKKDELKYEAWLNKMYRISKREGLSLRDIISIHGPYNKFHHKMLPSQNQLRSSFQINNPR